MLRRTETVMATIKAFFRDRRGTTAIEYVIIGSLLSIAIVGGGTIIGTKMNSRFQAVATKLS